MIPPGRFRQINSFVSRKMCGQKVSSHSKSSGTGYTLDSNITTSTGNLVTISKSQISREFTKAGFTTDGSVSFVEAISENFMFCSLNRWKYEWFSLVISIGTKLPNSFYLGWNHV